MEVNFVKIEFCSELLQSSAAVSGIVIGLYITLYTIVMAMRAITMKMVTVLGL